MKFSVNISLLFTEVPFLERFAAAARAGFSAVEFWWPPAGALPHLEEAVRDNNLTVACFNFDAGDMSQGDRGLLSDPRREQRFKENVPEALDLAKRLGCKNLNALVGLQVAELTRDQQLELARANVAWIADEVAAAGRTILIEALNTFEHGSYLIARTEDAVQFVRSIGRPNVMVQYDVYHMQYMEGNIAGTLSRHISDIGHIQIADCPGRGQPGTGEINFPYVLRHIDNLGYTGFVGLEYCRTTLTTEESLNWLPREARAAPAGLSTHS